MEPTPERPAPQPLSPVALGAMRPPGAAGAPQPPPAPPSVPPAWLRRWPTPAPGPARLSIAVVGLGVVGGATLLARAGLQWAGIGVALLVLGWAAARSGQRLSPADRRWRAALALIATGLLVACALRDSGSMTAIALLAALGLAAYACLPTARGIGIVLAPLLAGVASLRGTVWVARSARPRRPSAAALPALRGATFGIVLLVGVGALLSSADVAFAGLLTTLLPSFGLHWLPLRIMLGGVVTLLAAGVVFSAASPPSLAPGRALPARARLEWVLPLGALIGLLAVFFLVQAAVLFDAYPPALVAGDLTPAERARAGFGQLVVVTIVVATVLAWSAARVDGRDRRLLVGLGAVTVALLETLVASALRRMFLYEDAFGWSVLRLEVAVFEVWLGVLVPVAALLWLTGRGGSLSRVFVASAGLGILGLTLVGPDAVVAAASVDRYERTDRIDVSYLARLGPDATPVLARLPEPAASCVLGYRAPGHDPWYATNLSRVRADNVLAERAQQAPVPGSGGDLLQCPQPG